MFPFLSLERTGEKVGSEFEREELQEKKEEGCWLGKGLHSPLDAESKLFLLTLEFRFYSTFCYPLVH